MGVPVEFPSFVIFCKHYIPSISCSYSVDESTRTRPGPCSSTTSHGILSNKWRLQSEVNTQIGYFRYFHPLLCLFWRKYSPLPAYNTTTFHALIWRLRYKFLRYDQLRYWHFVVSYYRYNTTYLSITLTKALLHHHLKGWTERVQFDLTTLRPLPVQCSKQRSSPQRLSKMRRHNLLSTTACISEKDLHS